MTIYGECDVPFLISKRKRADGFCYTVTVNGKVIIENATIYAAIGMIQKIMESET